jgi:hypothetical protein
MAKEKEPAFTVTDRRLFSSEGELRPDVVESEERAAEREREKSEAQRRANEDRAAKQQAEHPSSVESPAPAVVPPELEAEAPSAQEQQQQADAYKQSTRDIDDRIRKEMHKQGQAHRAEDFEMTFDKFIASLYMNALMQLGLAAPQGAKPQLDIIGARQTIDILAILHEKTKGNLTSAEQTMLQNILYELRMAYLEVTNMITNPPPGGANIHTGS